MEQINPSKVSPSDQIGDYKLTSLISSGAMGSLWEVKHIPSHKQRVLKLFDATGVDVALKRQFIIEATTLKSLNNHPKNVRLPQVYEIATTAAPSHLPYYVMERIENANGVSRTLREIQCDLERDEEYSVATLTRWFLDVATTLKYLHNVGIVHGDIKPDNIMVDRGGHAVLIDFGAVRIVGEQTLLQHLQMLDSQQSNALKNFILGTKRFMAPEIKRGANPTRHSDVYSLGATFWQLAFDEDVCELNTSPENLIKDEEHIALLQDRRMRKVLPLMLNPYENDRASIEECLLCFNEKIDATRDDRCYRFSTEMENYDKSLFEPLFGSILSTLDTYAALLSKLQWENRGKHLKGEDVIAAIYGKYRKVELQLLKKLYTTPSINIKNRLKEKLGKLDNDFYSDFNAAQLTPLADILFLRLNTLWASLCHDGNYSIADRSLMEKCISIARSYLPPAAQFVFGKYRHIEWKLDSARYFTNMHKSAEYRGERAADRLFMYERTLASYVPSSDIAAMHLSSLAHRNKVEKLTPKYIIDFKPIWGLP